MAADPQLVYEFLVLRKSVQELSSETLVDLIQNFDLVPSSFVQTAMGYPGGGVTKFLYFLVGLAKKVVKW